MPWYELFCLARPQLARGQQAELFKTAAKTVLNGGGVLTDLKNFGERRLAYDIRRPGFKFTEAFMWQISFVSHPAVLQELEHNLKVNESILRHILVKKEPFKHFPSTYAVKKRATRILSTATRGQQQEL